MGARPMARVIQDNLKKPLANELLFGSLVDGGQVTVALDKEKNALTYGFQSAQSTSRKPRINLRFTAVQTGP